MAERTICKCNEDFAPGEACMHNSAEPCELKDKKVFANGDAVRVYDRYRFAIPIRATVKQISDLDGGVEVVLEETNNAQYPVGSTIWVDARQLERDSPVATTDKSASVGFKKTGTPPHPLVAKEKFKEGYDDVVASDRRISKEAVNSPAHYGGADSVYEVIRVLEAWGLDKDALLFNVIKYISRAGKKDPAKEQEDLSKAKWYLERKIANLDKSKPDLEKETTQRG